MKALERNEMWVRDCAWDIGVLKTGLAQYCFTIGEVKEAMGFAHNTVKKHLGALIERGVVREVVISKSVTIYKFSKRFIEARTSQMALPGIDSTYQGEN